MLTDLASLTLERLNRLGLHTPEALAGATIAVWRSSAKAKYHWADNRVSCQHVDWGSHNYHRQHADPLVTEKTPALGFTIAADEVCRTCAGQITVSPEADRFVGIATELAKAADWISDGRELRDSTKTDWLTFARWQARAPLQGDTWLTAADSLSSNAWRSHGRELRDTIAHTYTDMRTVRTQVRDGITEDPTRTALLERAVHMVETDTTALTESNEILGIAGCPKPVSTFYPYERPKGYQQDQPWNTVAGLWFTQRTRGLTVSAADIADHVDSAFPHVHDLTAMSCECFDVPYESGDCVHTWSLRIAAVHRRRIIAEWIARLDLALEGLRDHDATPDSSPAAHLVVVDHWPLVRNDDKLIAYLAQFEPAGGPFTVTGDPYSYDRRRRQVVVLRVPQWAAAHVAELPQPMRCEAATDDPYQVGRMMRAAGIALTPDDFTGRRKPSKAVAAARAEISSRSGPPLREWYRVHRPLSRGAQPPPGYGDHWEQYGVLRALGSGGTFLFGEDDVELLKLAFPPEESRSAATGTVAVEIPTACNRYDCPDGPHICNVDCDLVGVTRNGRLQVRPKMMEDTVTIPEAYLVSFTGKG